MGMDGYRIMTPLGMLAVPAARAGERKIMGFSDLVLFEVDDPPGYGYRLVGVLMDGVARVWDLPGYTRDEAYTISRTWSEYPETLLGLPIRPGHMIELGRSICHHGYVAASRRDGFRWTLGIASDGVIYADTDPFAGRAIQAIRIHALAVAARDRISR